SYDGRYVGIGDSKSLIHLGRNVPDDVMDRLSTRRMLLGAGWTVESFAQAVRMQLPG
ncbi:MAG TPA: N-acetyltransferase, partial [Delftia acidovorans]|nr:N-acetyltransferase [Delftia acidovorans]